MSSLGVGATPPDACHVAGALFHGDRLTRFNPAMPERPLEPWMTGAAGPFVTIKPGGPLRGVVTISATEDDTRLLIEAKWTSPDGDPRSVSHTLDGYDAARRLAHVRADMLVIGREPEPA